MSEQLKPCPFCGNAEGREPELYGVKCWQERRFRGQSTKGTWVAECLNCGISVVENSTEDEAIAAWNRRAPMEAAAQAMYEALKAIMPLLENLESKLLVGDEGCIWAAEIARAALAKAVPHE